MFDCVRWSIKIEHLICCGLDYWSMEAVESKKTQQSRKKSNPSGSILFGNRWNNVKFDLSWVCLLVICSNEIDCAWLTKLYCEFDYVGLPNLIAKLVFDWVRSRNQIKYPGNDNVSLKKHGSVKLQKQLLIVQNIGLPVSARIAGVTIKETSRLLLI